VADSKATDEVSQWYVDGDMVREAYTLRKEDDDWGQAGTLVREVLDDDARERLVSNIVGHLSNGVSQKVRERAVEYWKNIDREIGRRVSEKL